MIFSQAEYDLRCEWGAHGVAQLALERRVAIVVDVLSFSTAVDIAVTNGAIVVPRPAHAGESVRTRSGYSLSPASLLEVPAGYRLELPSPNGAALSLAAAAAGAATFTACLRNAGAVARAARQLGPPFAVIPAGERWPDGSLRPALEDWIAAGAVLSGLPGRPSPEAEAAIAAYASLRHLCGPLLHGCSSGKELIARGFVEDVGLAGELDVSSMAPLLRDGAFSERPLRAL